MSLYPREGAKVKQDAEEAPLVELQGSLEGNEDDLVSTTHPKTLSFYCWNGSFLTPWASLCSFIIHRFILTL